MVTLVDHRGRPLERQALRRTQTAGLQQLHQTWADHPARGLTPERLARLLEDAEQGDIGAQHDLFLDMEERDPHLHAELSKRRRTLMGLSWSVEPPPRPTAAETRQARRLEELIRDLPDLEDALLDALDAIGHGFAALEIEWTRSDGAWLPAALRHRPQSWFQVDRATRTELHLRDNSIDGAPLWPFGWILHIHKAKSGYLSRGGLYRVLVWPWIMKQYALQDLAEFLDVYGLPAKIGKYPNGADPNEKQTLYRAVRQLGRQAAGIMPREMEIEFLQAAEGSSDPFMAMAEYADLAESKAILGQTLSATAQSTGLGSGVAQLQGEVRRDLLLSDARQLAGTLSRQLLWPVAVLNGLAGDPRRAPRWTFDTHATADLKDFSTGIKTLVEAGLDTIPADWVHEQLGIPQPDQGQATLAPPRTLPGPMTGQAAAALRLPSREADTTDYADLQTPRLDAAAAPQIEAMLARIRRELDTAPDLPSFQRRLLALYPELSGSDLTALLGEAFAAADLAGRYDLDQGD